MYASIKHFFNVLNIVELVYILVSESFKFSNASRCVFVYALSMCTILLEYMSHFFATVVLFLSWTGPICVKVMQNFSNFQAPTDNLMGYGSLVHGYEWYETLSATIKANITTVGFGDFVLLL